MRLRAFVPFVVVLLSTGVASADEPSPIDMQEHFFGAANIGAVAGHGGLTISVSSDGDLTTLAWPGPSYADQLAYLSSNDLDVRKQPHFGAHDGMGSYLGLLVTTKDGIQLVWLRDAKLFTSSQRYTTPDAPVPETTFTSIDLGLTVVLTDIVSPEVDLLTRRMVVTRKPGSKVTAASMVLYENLSPTVSRIPMVPLVDWALDSRNDFVAVYQDDAVMHLQPMASGEIRSIADVLEKPEDRPYGPVDALMKSSTMPAGWVAQLQESFQLGVTALVTTEPKPTSFQVGSDATPICASVAKLIANIKALPKIFPGLALPIDPGIIDKLACEDALPAIRAKRGWTWMPEDALSDLKDGALSGSTHAGGQTNAALVTPLTFSGDVAEGSALFAFGKNPLSARETLTKGTSVPAASRQAAAEAKAHDALGAVKLPDPALGPRVVDVSRRALMNVYVARDRGTGAIVASVSRQPPYFIDWPRDGSFFMQGLDVAGLHPWVTQRAQWYATIIRTEAVPKNPILTPVTTTDPDTGDQEFPAHAWEMNYYADGTIGGNIRFEIDNTALHLWATVAHAAYLTGRERADFLAKVWPTCRDALHLLMRWRDPKSGLPWPANEDDHFELTSTLHGATTVYVALLSGARMANAVGESAEARAMLSHALELQKAIVATYYDPKSGLFRDAPQSGTDYIPGTTGSGSTAWLAWPARVLDPKDPRLETQLLADLNAVMKDIRGETGGGAYVMKNVVSAALLGKDDGSRKLAREAVQRLADIATKDTQHFGEVFVTSHPAGSPPIFSQRVAQPHVWEGMIFYLSAMALTSPERFDAQTQELPLPKESAWLDRRDGCGCSLPGAQERAAFGGFSAIVLSLWMARRAARRSAR